MQKNLKGLAFMIFSLILSINLTHAQIDLSGNVEARSWLSTDEESPFWLFTNNYGRFDNMSNFYGSFQFNGNYTWKENSNLKFGVNLGYSDGIKNEVFAEEYFVEYSGSWLKATLGRKRRQLQYNGLSVSNENIAWGINNRPIPGLRLETAKPIFFKNDKGLGFEAMWSDYLLEKDRFVSRARLHHKSFHLVYKTGNGWFFKGGIHHFAQWSGTPPGEAAYPSGLVDYARIVAGRGGGEDALQGEQINALGNHLGSYELYIDKGFEKFNFRFIYNSIFEDGSGSRLANFPDGLYGIFIDFETNNWVNSFIYEFYYTKHQSQTVPHLWDNYFNNGLYASGWTYKGNVIGLPLLTTNYYEDYPARNNTTRIGNNRVIAHHFGVSGFAFKKMPYRFLLTYRNNNGHNVNRGVAGYESFTSNDPRGEVKLPKQIISSYFQINLLKNYLELDLFLGADISRNNKNFGGGLSLKREIF